MADSLLTQGSCEKTGVRVHAAWWGVDHGGPNIPQTHEHIVSLIDANGGVEVFAQHIQIRVGNRLVNKMGLLWQFSLPAQVMQNATFGGDPAFGVRKVLALDMEFHQGASFVLEMLGIHTDGWGHDYDLRGWEGPPFSVSYRYQIM